MDITRTMRGASWLAVAGLLGAALIAPSSALAAGPGNNGLDTTGNGTKSNATVGGSLSAAGGSATMNANAEMFCDGTSVGSVGGSFTLNSTLDSGSTITIYMVPNVGSNADPAANVTKNEATITFNDGNRTSGTVIPWTVNVTNAFTVSSGGILVVFAVNNDGTTAISSSKTNSLNCTESSSTTSSSTSSTTSSETTSTTSSVTTSTTTVSSETTSTTTTKSTTTTPAGSVEAETGTPRITPPPTDSLTPGGPSNGSWQLALLGMAGLLTAMLLLTPVTAARRNKR